MLFGVQSFQTVVCDVLRVWTISNYVALCATVLYDNAQFATMLNAVLQWSAILHNVPSF